MRNAIRSSYAASPRTLALCEKEPGIHCLRMRVIKAYLGERIYYHDIAYSVYSIQGRVKIRGNEWVNERDVEQFYSS